MKTLTNHKKSKVFLAVIAAGLTPTCILTFLTQKVVRAGEQGRPRTVNRASKQIALKAGGDLQVAINAAARGDTIVVPVADYNTAVGFKLPIKAGSFNGSNYITIQSSNLGSLPSGRVSKADATNMPRFTVTARNTPVFTVSAGASGYKLIGLEIKNNLTGNTSGDITNTMVDIDYGANNIVFDRVLVHPNEHPTLANNWLTRGKFAFNMSGSYITLKNSYVYDFFGRDPVDAQLTKGSAQQTEAVYISPTSHHITLDNNYLEAWYSIIQTAGSDGIASSVQTVLASPAPTLSAVRLSSVAGLSVGMIIAVDLPHSTDPQKCKEASYGDRPCWAVGKVASIHTSTGDVTFSPDLITVNQYGNRVVPHAMPSVPGAAIWAGTQPADISVTLNTLNLPIDFSTYHKATNGNGNKGIIETKAVLGFTFEGNIITGYPGSLALTTANQNGGCPWCTTANVRIRNNWFQSYRDLSLLSLTDYGELATQGHDILIENNLATNREASDGSCVRIGGAGANVIVRHNTCVGGYPDKYTGVSFLASESSNGAPASLGGYLPYYPVLNATGVVIKDNLVDAGNYTATCYRVADNGGGSRFLGCFSKPTQSHNMFVLNVPGADPLYQFPGTTNKVAPSWAAVKFVGSSYTTLSDWRLQAGSPGYRAASDGTDIGVNIDLLNQALFGTGGSVPTSAPAARPTTTRPGY